MGDSARHQPRKALCLTQPSGQGLRPHTSHGSSCPREASPETDRRRRRWNAHLWKFTLEFSLCLRHARHLGLTKCSL